MLFLVNSAKADIINKFPYVCVCDRSINTFQYLACKNKMGSTLLELQSDNISIKNSFDEKIYQIQEDVNTLTAIFFNKNYQSTISLNENLSLLFSIFYPKYNKEWSYKLKCISTKQ
ncbi:MAG: hypothetical protein O3C61_02360 [Proteobacteria bacterium]|nr:hypothetical protein [Pseudomonadota bacterium]